MKFSKFIILAITGLSLTCCEQILDKKDLSAVNEFDVWNDLELATAYMNRIYAQALPSWNDDYSNYSDEADGGGNYMYGQLTENSVNYWPYDEIREINILLANIDDGTLTEPDRKLLKGQALFFRAWLYFEMVRLYGGVPLVLEPQELTDDLLVKRSPTSAVITQIIKDLDDAVAFLPDIKATSGSNDGHVHKGTAMAVKGRVLLYYASPQFDPAQSAAGRWQAAYDANKTAKDYLVAQGYGLHADFGGLWISEMSKEAIFVKRYKYLPTNSASYHNWSAATRPLDASQGATGANRPALEMVTAFPMKDGKSIKSGTSAYTYDSIYFWKNRDPRFSKTIVYNGAQWQLSGQTGRIQWTYVGGEQNNPTITGFYMRKAVDEAQTAIEAYNSGTDWIEIRFAEVLLNLAEAANETGKTPEAYTELTAIRKRAGIDAGTNNLYGLDPNMTKDQMRKAIMLERKIELAYEGKRYWDLRRCRLFESELNGTRRHGYTVSLKVPTAQWNDLRNSMTSPQLLTHLDQKYADYFKHTYKLLDTQFDIKWKPEYYFFAIPAEHLQLNSNLEQTMGWAGGTFDPLK